MTDAIVLGVVAVLTVGALWAYAAVGWACPGLVEKS